MVTMEQQQFSKPLVVIVKALLRNLKPAQYCLVLVALLTMWSTGQQSQELTQTYTGSTAQTMKGRHKGHTYDMKHPNVNGTCLSRYVHKLKRMNAPYTIKWDIVKRSTPYNPITNICRVCVQEKHHILFHPEDASLNQRSEFFTICRHKEKHLLVNS